MGSDERFIDSSDKTIQEAKPPKGEAQGGSEPRAGTRLGPFRLLELLGQGGMGTVFLAEQLEPVRRRVAVKLLQESLFDPSHLARFAVEQQALARMSHPAIAQVYDAGTTEDGRPYFAMEHVPGQPITQFCRTHGLDLRQRLELFAKVCWGVQHAHQKGLVHRDLKPGNILVAMVDGAPSPKIIDFGIATAVRSAGEGREHHSAKRDFAGTLQYMSPEQADLPEVDLDTRSDIYSLGAVLYELLTGRTPLDPEGLSRTTREELRRLLLETKIRPPSRQLEQVSSELPGLEGAVWVRRRLYQQLQSEVDWIVLKALATDRTDRYPTAAAMAQDLEAFLSGRPVEAVPPSRSYRWSKVARRHKALLLGSSAVAAALLCGLALATWGFLQAREQRDRALEAEAVARVEAAKSERVAAFTQEMLAGVDPAVAGDLDRALLRKILEAAAAKIDTELAGQPEVAAAIHGTIGRTYAALTEYPPALEHLSAAVGLLKRNDVATLGYLTRIGNIQAIQGDLDGAEALLQEAVSGLIEALGEEHQTTLVALQTLADVYRSQGRLQEAEPLYLQVVAAQRRTMGEEHRGTLHSLNALAKLYHHQGRAEEALAALERIAATIPGILGQEHPMTLNAQANLATALVEAERYQEAEALYLQAVEGSRRVLGPDHHLTISYTANLAALMERQGRLEETEPLYLEVLAARRRLLGPDYRNYTETITELNNLGGLYRKMGRHQEGSQVQSEAVSAARRVLPAGHWLLGVLLSNYGAVLTESGRHDEAERALLEAKGILEGSLGAGNERTGVNAERLAELRRRRQG